MSPLPMRRIAPVLVLILGLTACGGDDAMTTGDTSPAIPEETSATSVAPPGSTGDLFSPTSTKPASPRTSSSSGLPPAERAVADLAERLGVDAEDVELVSMESVTWPDTSLGCPQPGMAYNQVLTEGSLIVLEVDGRRHRYHAGPTGDPFYCATPSDPVRD